MATFEDFYKAVKQIIDEDQEAPEAPEASEKVLSIREAVFSSHETIPVTEAEGRIAGAPTVSCPPAAEYQKQKQSV